MGAELWVAAGVALALLAYLTVVLLLPERF
ncbi:MAG: potassium-transporting ATPase subunit F [Anaerolineales bacterium]|nr:potassium-transporting ATPase subunit F [Anaerolineales bacterium]